MIYIDMPKALEALRKAVEERGEDYVDPNSGPHGRGCVYADEDGPGCIVDTALVLAGLPVTELLGCNGGVEDLADSFLPGDVLNFDDAGINVLMAAQRAQDYGQPWGDALTQAELVAAEIAEESEA